MPNEHVEKNNNHTFLENDENKFSDSPDSIDEDEITEPAINSLNQTRGQDRRNRQVGPEWIFPGDFVVDENCFPPHQTCTTMLFIRLMKKNGMESNPNRHFRPRNAGAIFALRTKLINLHMQ